MPCEGLPLWLQYVFGLVTVVAFAGWAIQAIWGYRNDKRSKDHHVRALKSQIRELELVMLCRDATFGNAVAAFDEALAAIP